ALVEIEILACEGVALPSEKLIHKHAVGGLINSRPAELACLELRNLLFEVFGEFFAVKASVDRPSKIKAGVYERLILVEVLRVLPLVVPLRLVVDNWLIHRKHLIRERIHACRR